MSEAKRKEMRVWRDFIDAAVLDSGIELSDLQRQYLAAIFYRLHHSPAFFQLLHTVQPMVEYQKAQQLRRRKRISQLALLGDVCLQQVSFPRFISRHTRRFDAVPSKKRMEIGVLCYEVLAEALRERERQQLFFAELSEGFTDLVEVLWSVQDDVYHDLHELFRMAHLHADLPWRQEIARMSIT